MIVFVENAELPQELFALTESVAEFDVADVNLTFTVLPVVDPTKVAPPVIVHEYEVAPVTEEILYVTFVLDLQTDELPEILPGVAGAGETTKEETGLEPHVPFALTVIVPVDVKLFP